MAILRQSTADNHLLTAALNYAARNWSIIAVKGKRAAGPWKRFQVQPPDEATLRRMIGRRGVSGLAVILGCPSGGLACRDFDNANSYRRWAADHPDLAARLPTVRTSRGHHVYFRGPDGYRNLGDGEYRADAGHYCLLPRSRHPDGPTYTWLIPLPSGELPEVDPITAGLTLGHSEDTHDTDNQHLTLKTQHPSPIPQPPSPILMCEHENIPSVIAATLPTGPGQRFHKLFALGRQLKAAFPDADATKLKPIVRQWFVLALPIIQTKEWSETREDVTYAWRSIGAKWAAFVESSKTVQTDTGDHDGAAAVAIIKLCATLQAYHGDGVPFPLSCRKAGDAAGITHERAARILRMLAFEGIIQLVKAGATKGSGKAAVYLFLGGRQ